LQLSYSDTGDAWLLCVVGDIIAEAATGRMAQMGGLHEGGGSRPGCPDFKKQLKC